MKEIFRENRKKRIDELSLFILLAKNFFVLVNINLSRFFPIPWIPWFRFDQIFTRLEFFFFSGSLLCAKLRFKIAQFFFYIHNFISILKNIYLLIQERLPSIVDDEVRSAWAPLRVCLLALLPIIHTLLPHVEVIEVWIGNFPSLNP